MRKFLRTAWTVVEWTVLACFLGLVAYCSPLNGMLLANAMFDEDE